MKKLRLFFLAMVLAVATPLGLASQQLPDEGARYKAATDWVNLVIRDHNYRQAARAANPAVASQMTPAAIEAAWVSIDRLLGDLISLKPKKQSLSAAGVYLTVLEGAFVNPAGRNSPPELMNITVTMAPNNSIYGFDVRGVRPRRAAPARR